ncbi:hypothetical protein [Afipia sp. DC4300-2b1]|uniref:hypothetical protein n=1 Tax=Afipia sp. DC4300-2b1 TaxID=2804672 RepID=UPI003CEDBB5F
MSKTFEVMFLPLAAVKLPLYPLHVESHQDRLQQASAVAADGFNARPVLIDENAIVVDGADTYCALYYNSIDKVKVLLVGGASEKELRTLRRALRALPNLNIYTDKLVADFECLLDAGYPIHSYIAGLIELLESFLPNAENHAEEILADATASPEAWES